MKRVARWLVLLAGVGSYGCGDEVGPCKDERAGQDTVVVGGSIQYGGQAIMNLACAQGCHSSQAQGASRRGAPAGLDFDLRPVDPDSEDVVGTAMSGDAGTVLRLSNGAASALRARQRRIFEDRERIWQQVKDGLMPPGGAFASFRTAVRSIFNSDESNPCVAARTPYEPITEKSTQDVLRMWLACGAPIVEATSPLVESYGAPGAAGFQYPVCEDRPADDGGVGDGGSAAVVTLESVYERVFDVHCVACHMAGGQAPDFSTPELAYDVFVADDSEQCEGKPYVSEGSPTESYLYELVAERDPGCGDRMPLGSVLSATELRLISDWIAGGALREADVDKSVRAASGGLDAGVP